MTTSDHMPGAILAAQVAHSATPPDEPAYTELRYRLQERAPVTAISARHRDSK
ncbi:hypothetical protein [Nocardia pneumoniae]|uniref:hypothetical protein n=1 Tax=Nocardia pneumoniae TaxID=228601 RepID=UPI0012F6368C|nr:hypothetical protein [Nocardia pneumoniae]